MAFCQSWKKIVGIFNRPGVAGLFYKHLWVKTGNPPPSICYLPATVWSIELTLYVFLFKRQLFLILHQLLFSCFLY